MANEDLPIPLEIPWRLVSTTQELKPANAAPEVTTISLFMYEPHVESLQADYPDERVVYLKFTVSVSPFFSEPMFGGSGARTYLAGGLPVWHLMLDLKVTPNPVVLGGFRPYFHAAAPVHRTMIQSGVVGHEVFEGTSDAISIGKSASQLHETMSSKTKTKTSQSGGGAAFLIPAPLPIPATASVSSSTSTTAVDSERHVDQYLETTTRDASQERRELLSHTTNVQNVFTLLNLKHLGSPYLRFCLWPRPLVPLSIGPLEPTLWYHQLLQRRSSGIEGIQEFIVVVVAPKNRGFCVHARLRELGLVDAPPTPPDYYALRDALTSDQDRAEIDEYLHRLYPTGTPTDELDVDLGLSKEESRGAVVMFNVETEVVRLLGRGIGPENQPLSLGTGQLFFRMYKTNIEVRLELIRAKYEEELARSPLERGIALLSTKFLTTCFDVASNDALEVESVDGPGPLFQIYDPGPLPQAIPVTATPLRGASRYVRAVTKWNALSDQLAQDMSNQDLPEEKMISASHPKVVQILLDRWQALPPESPKNVPLAEAAAMLSLTVEQTRLLERAEVGDLRGLARVINSVPRIERLNTRLRDASRLSVRRGRSKPRRLRLAPVKFPISEGQARALREAIGRALMP